MTTGWVYREKEVSAALQPPAPQVKPKPPAVSPESTADPLVVAGMSLFVLGVTAAGLMSMAAVTLLATPVRIARHLFKSD